MIHSKSKKSVLIVVTVLALVCSFLPAGSLRASDLGDSRSVALNRGVDIGDLYFFIDPSDPSFAVLAVTLGGYIAPSQNANLGFFDGKLRVRFMIENTGDATVDKSINVTFSPQTSRTTPQTATIVIPPKPGILPSGRTFTAPTTISRGAFGANSPPTFGGGNQSDQIPTVTSDSGVSQVSFFGGLIDDPFFFDLGAELAYRRSRIVGPTNPAILTRGRDSFAGTNTLVVALRVPVALLTGSAGSVVGLSVATYQSANDTPQTRLDRLGNPLINTIMTSYAIKDKYNSSRPQDDANNTFGHATDINNNLIALQTDSTFRAIIFALAVTNGDMLRLDTSVANTGPEGGNIPSAAYPNGRRPNDDVVDTILTLINNGVFQGDAVNDNELPLKNAFPFFAQPHMPFPPAADDLTRN